jgi:hypothetical protein
VLKNQNTILTFASIQKTLANLEQQRHGVLEKQQQLQVQFHHPFRQSRDERDDEKGRNTRHCRCQRLQLDTTCTNGGIIFEGHLDRLMFHVM